MKKILRYILLLIALIPLNIFAISKEYTDVAYKITNSKIEEGKINLYFFRMDGCPHCAEEEIWLKDIKENYNDYLNVYEYEVKNNKTNRKYYNDVKKALNDDVTKSVPYTVIGKTYFVGFSEAVSVQIENKIKELINDNVNNENINNEDVKIPILGNVNKKKVSIPLVAMILGAVDGFNPCAMWILLLLINMCISIKDKKKMRIVGFTFILSSGLVYFLSMLGIGFILDFSTVIYIRNIIAILAIILGIYNLYVYIKTRKDTGCHVMKKEKRKSIITRINKILANKSFILMILGTTVLSVSVNLVELACSLGFPAIFLEILTLNKIIGLNKVLYLLIYIFFYIIDDLIILILSLKAFETKGISTKYNKYVNLIAGILLVLMGILLIFKPEWVMINF